MHRRAKNPFTRFALSVLLLVCPLSAAAEEPGEQHGEKPDAATLATARALAMAGVKLAREGQCSQAIDSLERAEALYHSAIVSEQLGNCYRSEGRLVEAAELFRKVLREPLPPDASEAVQQAYQRADAQLQETRQQIATLIVSVEGPPLEALKLQVDGREVPRELVGQARLTDPGLHQLRVEAPGFETASQSIELAPGQVRRVQLAPRRAAAPIAVAAQVPVEAAPVARSAAAAAPPAPPVEQEDHGLIRKRRAALALSISGAALLAAGGAFSYLAVDGKNELERDCPDSVCRPRSRQELDQAKAFGLSATLGLAVGGAALVVAGVLYLVTREPRRETRQAASTRAKLTRPTFSLEPAGLRARF